MKIVYNRHKGENRPVNMARFTAEKADAVRRYHQSISTYEPTVLADLSVTGRILGQAVSVSRMKAAGSV